MSEKFITVYNLKGEKIMDREISEPFFQVTPKSSVIHQVMIAFQSNARPITVHTKDRSEVRGGGRKPWRQKGTGRARHGSIRSPLWRGGGVTFGPTPERNYHVKVNKKMKQKALFMLLTDKVDHEKVFLLDSLDLPSVKTKEVKRLFALLPTQGAKALVGLSDKNPNFIQAVRNLSSLTAVGIESLNVMDLLNHEYFITTESGLKKIAEIFRKVKENKKVSL
jgi:large subunit ribosomal protein L4